MSADPSHPLTSDTSAPPGTVARVLAVLCCFAEKPRWSLVELANRLGLPKSTMHRLLQLCKNDGFIDLLEGGGYGVGVEFHRVAAAIAARAPLVDFAVPLLKRISAQTNEVSFIAVLVPEKLRMTYLAKADPSEEFRYHIDLNVLKSICWGGCGRAILAHLPEPQIAAAIAQAGPSPSGNPFDPVALRSDLQTIRARGYCISLAQHRQTAVGVAVPFFDANGAIKGSLGLSIPIFRFQDEMIPGLLGPLNESTRELNYFLGGSASTL